MSAILVAPVESQEQPSQAPMGDTLSAGLGALLVATIAQRLVGLIRNLLFCRYLTPEELGRWNLAFSFLMLAAPLVALGLPGAFGRYVEHYRGRGQLRTFLRHTAVANGALALAALIAMLLMPGLMAWIVFKDAAQTELALITVLALAVVIPFNYLTELLTSLREVRAASAMQFISSIVFAVVGMSLIRAAHLGATGVVIGYAAASLAACVVALRPLKILWRALPVAAAPLSPSSLWSKLLPLAMWVWTADLLANLFDVADRYMLLHLAAGDAHAASALVGQYHASRVVPTLMISLVAMVSRVLLPYLAHDWESGRRERVSSRSLLAIKLGSVSLVTGSAAFLVVAPWIFQTVLEGKYEAGLGVLPQTLIYSVWFSLKLFAINYLFCAEQGKLGSLALVVGLIVNLVLNAILAPRYGLEGAVLATVLANGVTLAASCLLARRLGLQIDRGTIAALALPLCLWLAPWIAIAAAIALIAVALKTTWIFSTEERTLLNDVWRQYTARWVKTTAKA